MKTLTRPPQIVRDPEIMGGTPVFAGTRVPIATLFDYLQHGHRLSEFLDQFPSVQREQVLELFDFVRTDSIGDGDEDPAE